MPVGSIVATSSLGSSRAPPCTTNFGVAVRCYCSINSTSSASLFADLQQRTSTQRMIAIRTLGRDQVAACGEISNLEPVGLPIEMRRDLHLHCLRVARVQELQAAVGASLVDAPTAATVETDRDDAASAPRTSGLQRLVTRNRHAFH